MRISIAVLAAFALVPSSAFAATYTVGPTGRQYTQLSIALASLNLEPGDIVLVDGNATYTGGIVVGSEDDGAAGNPVTIRWNRAAGATRPLLSGGQHTIKFEQSNHVVFEGFDVTGGTSSCVFNEAHEVLVRDVLVRDCPSHGILGADQNSGSFTLEYSEVRRSGSGTTRHSMYMQNDQMVYPDAVFRMRFNYVHSGNGGILMRSRYTRSEVYYNWFEGSTNEEVEFIGPDCESQKAGWTADLRREDADFVGNVIVHTSNWRNAIRAGGDLVGRSQGRLRIANNTIIFDSPGTSVANAVDVRLGLESLEMHNNVIHRVGPSPLAALYELPASETAQPYACSPQSREPWVSGRKVAGSHNWIESGANAVPPEWVNTRQGADPQLASIAQRLLRPVAGSPLVNAGTNSPATPVAFPFTSPQRVAAFDPPLRAKMAIGDEHARLPQSHTVDIGALEETDIDDLVGPFILNGSSPLLPPSSATATAPVASAAVEPARDVAPVVVTEPRNERAGARLQRWLSTRWNSFLRLIGWRR
ncbi:right-handed parallel beta-helix repeat-containing protein [Cognatilysobacter tabacisoli]|uniref:hypothetical protein n=1 Tax=Cognatilysobacter tabacisoli TaxID=2315424 RepID=UPI000E6B1D60|nr:hypothetical protein [Lysobacter tabacisoli]